MRVDSHRKEPNFKGFIDNTTSKVQSMTLLNRGLMDVGYSVCQVSMSNNKDEKRERLMMSGAYLVTAFLSPFLLLPIFNKNALKLNKVINSAKGKEKEIIKLSKSYLSQDATHMVEGIKELGHELNCEKAFEDLLNRFPDKEVLRQKLINASHNVLTADFLTTSLMWVFTPWATTEMTQKLTNKKTYSATYNMEGAGAIKDESDKKKKKLVETVLIGAIPAVVLPLVLKKSLNAKNTKNAFMKVLNKRADLFDYKDGVSMSKLLFLSMWALCDYPAALVSARDKYERKDRAIRSGATLLVFNAGDFLMNNVIGRALDRFGKTKIMDRSHLGDNPGFFKKFLMDVKNIKDIKAMKNVEASVVKRSKSAAIAMYWTTLFANMALSGLLVPAMLNKMLKNSLTKDFAGTVKESQPSTKQWTAGYTTMEAFLK